MVQYHFVRAVKQSTIVIIKCRITILSESVTRTAAVTFPCFEEVNGFLAVVRSVMQNSLRKDIQVNDRLKFALSSDHENTVKQCCDVVEHARMATPRGLNVLENGPLTIIINY